jgi:hypothetical protein
MARDEEATRSTPRGSHEAYAVLHLDCGELRPCLHLTFEYDAWPLEPVISAFELLARSRASLGVRHESWFEGLVHPVHQRGAVYTWELDGSAP